MTDEELINMTDGFFNFIDKIDHKQTFFAVANKYTSRLALNKPIVAEEPGKSTLKR